MTYRKQMRSLVAVGVCVVAGCGPDEADGPCKDMLLAGDLVITEVFADYAAPTGGTGTDEGKEWFEVYNNADRPVSLKGLTVVHSRPDGSKAASHAMDDVTIAPGQYFTLGNSTADLVPPYIDYGYSADLGDFYNSDGGKLALKCGDSEIDSAIYDTVKSGRSRQLSNLVPPDYTRNDDTNAWCEAHDTEFEANNFGTPGQDNDCAPVVAGACNEAGTMRAVVSPAPGELVITEVMPSPAMAADADGEWFEVKALADVDLNGLAVDRAGDTTNPSTINDPACIHVAAGTYAVLAHDKDAGLNGGIPNVAGTFTATLVGGTTTAPGDISILSGATMIDAVSWTRSTNGRSLQLDPDLTDASANDDPSNFCDGTAPYGLGDLGTPGTANGQCTLLPPPGMCDGGGQLRAIVKPPSGALVITEFLANPAAAPVGCTVGCTDSTREWFEITNTGSTAFDLNELGLARPMMTPTIITSGACKSIPPGGFALFARSSDAMANAGLPAVDYTFTFSVVDSSGGVEVRNGTTILDAITWSSVTSGVSSQLMPGMFTTTANDSAANFCAATTGYGDMTNRGTPKAANVCP